MLKSCHFVVGCYLTLLMTGCACSDSRKPEAGKQENQIAAMAPLLSQENVTVAQATLHPVKGNKVQGTVIFTKVPEGIKVVADIDGLKPGKHGFHIHEHGDCGGDEAAHAGAHFNPTNSKHGGPDDPIRHVGDLGNLEADENGHAHYERVDKIISFEGKNSILGRSVIVHADVDDYTTQPAGASGAKISCGVIEAVPVR